MKCSKPREESILYFRFSLLSSTATTIKHTFFSGTWRREGEGRGVGFLPSSSRPPPPPPQSSPISLRQARLVRGRPTPVHPQAMAYSPKPTGKNIMSRPDFIRVACPSCLSRAHHTSFPISHSSSRQSPSSIPLIHDSTSSAPPDCHPTLKHSDVLSTATTCQSSLAPARTHPTILNVMCSFFILSWISLTFFLTELARPANQKMHMKSDEKRSVHWAGEGFLRIEPRQLHTLRPDTRLQGHLQDPVQRCTWRIDTA
ncbi:hypothetical protein CORC01_11690 [Colletotrichum orchidophilum]|uniref:Uncharacterized protein n=1 Tax=Colletotrichum orchidophilum TaxID=1209926 RepID=A0A1G4AVB5_9PEZI|nr:uncharacterized protein CORC01_11690 [Colletotrichum orchidophilum]OHE93051.1 hypothetical protein CORC01_11690 [Colletotrichum orchidophilum]